MRPEFVSASDSSVYSPIIDLAHNTLQFIIYYVQVALVLACTCATMLLDFPTHQSLSHRYSLAIGLDYVERLSISFQYNTPLKEPVAGKLPSPSASAHV